MKIGVNATYLIPGAVGGTEIYLRHLLQALAESNGGHHYEVLINRESEGTQLAPVAPGIVERPTGVPARSRPLRILWEQTVLPWLSRQYDVLFNPGFTAPWFGPVPSVTTFHDLQYRQHPEYFRPLDRWAWRVVLDRVAAHSARIVCISETTRQAFLRFYPEAASRTVRVYSGVDPQFFTLPWRPDRQRPYLLSVATLHPHKNLLRLLRAFATFRRAVTEARLVLAGMRGFASHAVASAIRELHLEAAVEIPGWLPRRELYALYQGAWALVAPSRYEGFGLPVLEALAMGVPVICSSIPVFRELAADAVWYFDPDSDQQLCDAIARIWQDEALRQRLSASGPGRARSFRWEATATAMVEVFAAAASQEVRARAVHGN